MRGLLRKVENRLTAIKSDALFALAIGLYIVIHVVAGTLLAYLALWGLLALFN